MTNRTKLLEEKFADREVLPPLDEPKPESSIDCNKSAEEQRTEAIEKLKTTPTAKLLQMKNAFCAPEWFHERRSANPLGLLTLDDIRTELNTRPHIVHGPEGKVLRRLKSQTGMTEEEIRKVPDFIRQLKEAKGS